MNYIRSGSNPEKLHIWGDNENVIIAEDSKEIWKIPLKIFDGLLKKFHRRFYDYPCHHKGAQVEEVWVYEGDIEVDDEKVNPILTHSERKVKLTYEDNYVIMYDVTWEYIVLSNIIKIEKDRKVYVQWDPLYEKVLCVHEIPNKICKLCEKANNEKRDAHQIEEEEFTIIPKYKLLK